MPRFALPRALKAALSGALLIGSLLTGPAQAQSVTNVASATWADGGQARSINSNPVTFDLARPPATIETFRPGGGGGTTFTITDPLCNGASIALPGTAGQLAADPTTKISAGTLLIFRIVAPAQNLDRAAIDRMTVTLSTDAGDSETLTVFETGVDTGVFVGAVPTRAIPPAPVSGDCKLSIGVGQKITISGFPVGGGPIVVTTLVDVLADPYGLVFDSEDGTPVSGARVTLVDAVTGAPARVFADDGVTSWPSSVISGEPVTDGAGTSYAMLPGEFRFPLAPLGTYRLQIEPPSPYTAWSKVAPPGLAGLTRPDGGPLIIVDGSYGGRIPLTSPSPVRIDIPVDRPAVSVTLTKTVSRALAAPGDAVFYTVTARNPDPLRAKRAVVLTDTPSPYLRLRPDSIRIDGAAVPAAVAIAPDGKLLTIALGDIAAGGRKVVTYAMTIRPTAPAGYANNRADAVDSRGIHAIASASVKIDAETIAARMTLIGQVTDGGCTVGVKRRGIPGVRIMLEDGSFAITDRDGRYHFEGLTPGTHVAQAAAESLPEGGAFTDCSRSTRSAGKANSRFIIGQGGSLIVADFAAALPAGTALATPDAPAADQTDRGAAGAETDWLAMGDGPNDFLFPTLDYNPRAPAVRVVIRHRKGQTVDLMVDGKPADKLAFDGQRASPQGYVVSIWRGIAIDGEDVKLVATVRNADGSTADQISRTVHFVATPARAEIVPARSRLLADGSHRPVLAVRIVDRNGRPVHAGLTGTVGINAPYESATVIDLAQTRSLSRLDTTPPTWVVKGDDGIALIELAPTMVSGPLHLDFEFTDKTVRRKQTLEAWIVPGRQKWTVVGLAEGAVGSRSIADAMEQTGHFDSDLGKHGRIALYAKGRVLGKFLLTAAYDSAKQKDDKRLLGAIDPKTYYTVFADGSDRRFDAASREKLYVRIEARGFYALYGDFVTGFDQTELARYQRTMTGAKAEASFGSLHIQAFAAKSGDSHRRDEIQGGGISGPYRLSSRAIVPNSEIVSLEVRDRFRSEVIVSRRVLARFVDYDIDLLSGTITFKEPILSRDGALNPQFIVADYDIDQITGGSMNAGVRADVTIAGKVRVGTTLISDTGASADRSRTDLAAIDIKAAVTSTTELRAEAAMSRNSGKTAEAWLVEVEHHDGKLDVLGYARSADEDFGLGQYNSAERGRRKVGVDARYNPTEAWSITGSAWRDDSLTGPARRDALQLTTAYRTQHTEARIGIASFRDKLDDGRTANSTVLEAGATQRLFDNKLELTAAGSVALGKSESIDLPARYTFGASYAITRDIKLSGIYEIANGDAIDARTARIGIDVAPWAGARIVTAVGQQSLAEYGKRSFAAFGLSQSLPVTKNLTLDATLDSSKTLGGFDASRLINQDHPAASGGTISENGTLAEDFTAVTLGGTYRTGQWIGTLRGELRNGQLADRRGVTAGVIRQLGEGSLVGAGFTWTRATATAGATTEVFDGAVSAAHRPDDSAFAFLGKLEFRSDKVTGAVAGEAGPAGRTALTVDGDAQSRRVIGSLSMNWSPEGNRDGQRTGRTEIGTFVGIRHNFDSYQGFDLAGTTLMGGLDARIGIGGKIEVGGSATVRKSLSDHTTSFAVGPQIGLSPTKDVLLTVGYNIVGFRDRDFSAARSTDKGVFATVRMKFDADSFRFLGLGR